MTRFTADQFPKGHPIRKQLEDAERQSTEILERAGEKAVRAMARRQYPEEDLQREIIREADSTPFAVVLERRGLWPPQIAGDVLGAHLYHVPNGGGRSAVEASILIGLGVRPGVFDLVFWLPVHRVITGPQGFVRDEYRGGLYLELKAGRNDLTDKQRAFGERARLVCYDAVTIRSIHEFRDAIADYLRGAMPLCK